MTSKAERKKTRLFIRDRCFFLMDERRIEMIQRKTGKRDRYRSCYWWFCLLNWYFCWGDLKFTCTRLNKHQRIHNQPFSMKLAPSLPWLTRNFKCWLRRVKRIPYSRQNCGGVVSNNRGRVLKSLIFNIVFQKKKKKIKSGLGSILAAVVCVSSLWLTGVS